jgi:hypothetical protein
MPASRLVQWGAIGGVIGGVAWAVSGVLAFVFPGVIAFGPEYSLFDRLGESFHAIAEGGMLLWLVGSHVQQAPSYGRLGTIGFVSSFVGTTVLFLDTWLYVVAGEATPTSVYQIGFVLGLLAWLVGFTLLGIATLRAKVLPRWCGLLLIVFFPLILFLTSFFGVGGILLGLLWLALGYVLWAWRDTPAEQPARVQ